MDKEPPKPKDRQFFLNRKIKDPESIRAKIIVEYNSKAVSHVHMQCPHPDFSKKHVFFLNPRVQPLYYLSLGAESCNLT